MKWFINLFFLFGILFLKLRTASHHSILWTLPDRHNKIIKIKLLNTQVQSKYVSHTQTIQKLETSRWSTNKKKSGYDGNDRDERNINLQKIKY